ncbi:hypothetical protein [Gordonia sihwensis]|uniref:hypothetical protein n=1 Tax=Gordonia sihwensis TaxID=173559 RepID=UPI003D99A88B
MATINTTPMYLVYQDENGDHHSQPYKDVVQEGTLTDPVTGDDMPVVGWSDEVV